MKNIVNQIVEQEIQKNWIKAIGLAGSYARNEAKVYSDVDIVCMVHEDQAALETHIEFVKGRYVVKDYYYEADLEATFSDPTKAVDRIAGLRKMNIQYDPDHLLRSIKERADHFVWTREMQKQADQVSGEMLFGWVEEVHKSLQGVLHPDVGRLLNGIFGVSYGLFNVLKVKHGILLQSENELYDAVRDHYQQCPSFIHLSNKAFGIKMGSLQERTIAGLKLFIQVVNEVAPKADEQCKDDLFFAKEEVEYVLSGIEM